jgi:TonB family protein
MDNLILYLLKVSVGITLFYLCYLVFFRKDTFFLRNRIFLILTLLLPAILPILKIQIFSHKVVPVIQVNTIGNIVFSTDAFETTISNTISSFDYNKLVVWIYFTIAALLLLRGAISILSTFKIIKKGAVLSRRFPKVVISENKLPPFSFFPYAVIPSDDYKSGNYKDILDHETAHVREGHTFDLLLSELFIAFQWFNPFIWLIKRSIILNHEYLADSVSLGKNISTREYQYRLLNFQTGFKNASLAHNFSSLIKNRIVMINKKSTPKFAALKNLLILPVLAFVLYAFTKPEANFTTPFDNSATITQPQADLSKEVKGIVVQEDGTPLPGATIVVKGTTLGTLSDEKGHFRLSNVPKEAMLEVSFVGFKYMVEKPDFASEMTITLKRSIVNTEKVDITPPKQRPSFDKDKVVIVEEMPMYPGGDKAMLSWISNSIKYPEEAIKGNIKGLINVSFIVSSSGKVKNVKVSKSVHPLLNAEAIRVISNMPDWKPGSQNGKFVGVEYMVPVDFK